MDPITMAIMALASLTQVVGGVLSEQGKASALKGQAHDEDATAANLRVSSGDARARGDVAAQEALLQGGQVTAKARAAYGSSGVDVASDTAQDVLATSQAMARHDSNTALNNAAREAWGLQQEARGHSAQAAALRKEGRFHATWGTGLAILGPTASLLGGYSKMGGGAGGAPTPPPAAP